MTPSEVQELLLSFQKAVIERTMAAEMNLHLDYRPARCAGPVGRADRGGQDILIAVVDGLKGLTDAIGTAFPRTTVQTGIVHLIRNSLDDAGGKDRKAVAAALRPIYAAVWQRAWENVTPFFVFPPDIRRVIDTTNDIESLNMQLRKIINEAAIKLPWLALHNVLAKSVRATSDWKIAMNQHYAWLFFVAFLHSRPLAPLSVNNRNTAAGVF